MRTFFLLVLLACTTGSISNIPFESSATRRASSALKVDTLTVSPHDDTLVIRTSGRLSAHVRTQFGDIPKNPNVAWVTRDPLIVKSITGRDTVATIWATSQPGSTYVVASSGSATDSARVTIQDANCVAIDRLEVLPEVVVDTVGQSSPLTGTIYKTCGGTATGTVAWTSRNAVIATAVSSGAQNATVTSHTAGIVYIVGTLTVGTVVKKDSSRIEVTDTSSTPLPTPPLSCSGTAIVPNASIQSAVNANPAGTVFCLGAGTFANQSSIVPKASQQFKGARDSITGARLSILDGGNTITSAFSGAAANVRIEGLKVTKYYGGSGTSTTGLSVAIFPNGSTGWVVYDNEVSYNTGAGIAITDNSIIRKNYTHHNGWLGMSCGGGNGDGALVDSNEVSFNNTRGISPNWGAGGIKCVPASNVVFRANLIRQNAGYGLWCDNCGGTTRYVSNRVDSNTYAGIYHEVSGPAVIDSNTTIGNGITTARGGVWVDNSDHVEVAYNTVIAKGIGTGILLRQVSRPDLPARDLNNAWVHHNTITLSGSSQYAGLVQFVSNNAYFGGTKNNDWDFNTWITTGAGTIPWRWDNANYTKVQWQAAGLDASGIFTP